MNTWMDASQWYRNQYPLMLSLTSQAPPSSATEHRPSLSRSNMEFSWSSLFLPPPPPPSPSPSPEKRKKKWKKDPCATTFRSSRSHVIVSFSFQSMTFVCNKWFRFRVWISLWHGTNMCCSTKPSQVGIITKSINNTRRYRVCLCDWFTEVNH